MRIAVTYDNGEVFQHFGHTAEFKKEIAIDTEDIGDISADVGLISYDARGTAIPCTR